MIDSNGKITSRRELVIVTGPRGVGKSWFAVSHARPSEIGGIYYHDSEGSANRTISELERQGLEIEHYVDLDARFHLPGEDDVLSRIADDRLPWVTADQRKSFEEYYRFVVSDISENMTPGKYHTYILDTIGTFEAAMAAYVKGNKKATGWSNDSYGRMWTEGVYPLYHHLINAIWARGVDTIFLCSHLKNVWSGSQPVPGKVAMSGKPALQYWSSLTIWLVSGSDPSGAPAGLVLKERMGQMEANSKDDEWDQRRMLPYRIPVCTWREIRRYLREGCDLSNPAPGESMSPDEIAMISPMFSNKQLELMIEQARLAIDENAVSPFAPPVLDNETVLKTTELAERVKAMTAEHDDTEILSILRTEGHKVPLIMRAIQKARTP